MPEHQSDLLTSIQQATQTLEEKAPNVGATEKGDEAKTPEQKSSDSAKKEPKTAKGGGIIGAILRFLKEALFGPDEKEEESETKDSLVEWLKKLFGIGKEGAGKQAVPGIETEVMQKKLDDEEVEVDSQQGEELDSQQKVGATEASEDSVSVSGEEKSQNQATRLSPEEQKAEIDRIEKESMAQLFKLIKTLSNGNDETRGELVEFVADFVSEKLSPELQERWNDTMKKVIADLGEGVEGQEGAEEQVEKAIGEELLGKIEEKSKEKSGKSTEVSMENAYKEVDAAGIGVKLGVAGVEQGEKGQGDSPRAPATRENFKAGENSKGASL
jgi:hypothetical protein